MQIDQRVAANDDGFVGFDKADAAHVCGKTVDLVDAFSCFQTVVGEREIEKLKVVRCCWFVFRFLNVNAAHPVTAINKILSQMMTDKPTSPCDQYTCRFRHSFAGLPSRVALKINETLVVIGRIWQATRW